MESPTRRGGDGRGLQIAALLLLLWTNCQQHALGCSSVQCGAVLTDVQGVFSSPCYPQKYPNSLVCRWTLQAPAGFIVQLSFLDFDLEEAPGCIYDRVLVKTGGADVKFCGPTASGLSLNSTGNLMELSFTSDFSVQKRGFSVSYRHVAVALRNQKVAISGGSHVARVSEALAFPELSELTLCFEVERTAHKQEEWFFSYSHGSSQGALGLVSQGGVLQLLVAGVSCPLDQSRISSSTFTSSMTPLCLQWSSAGGLLGVLLKGHHWTQTCSASSGLLLPPGGRFQLGGPHSLDGYMYNLRLWAEIVPLQQLKQLQLQGCDAAGSLLDWDKQHWDIPASQAQTDPSLSCSVSPPSSTAHTSSCDSTGLGCPEGFFYRLLLEVVAVDEALAAPPVDVERTVGLWLNETFRNWSHSVQVEQLSAQPQLQQPGSYSLQVLLVYFYTTNQSLSEAAVSTRLSSRAAQLSGGLQLTHVHVRLIENCPEEKQLHYQWPESRASVTQRLPCFPNKEQSASRTCLINLQNFSSYWSAADATNCTDIDTIEVSAENAAEVAVQLAVITNNQLSNEEVSKVVSKVKQLVDVARINSSLASTVVTIISNVMSSSHTPLQSATSGTALRTMDQLVHKLEFEGPSISFSSRHLAVGVASLNSSATLNGTTFSAIMAPNASEPQVQFQLEQTDVLGQVTLPASLLAAAEGSSPSPPRINFMFFSSTNLFRNEQLGRTLNSYVVASSVGNLTVRDLDEPVQIQIAHLDQQPSVNPLCVFWDFSLNGGGGGWNGAGCTLSGESGANRTVCLCDHLTHFGVLMDISGASPHLDSRTNQVLTFITYVGCGVSAVFSAATLLTYIAFEKLRRDYPSKILMNLSSSLLLLNLVFLLDGWLASLGGGLLCRGVAALLHYFLLTSFTWMGLESVHMYIALVKVFNTYIRRYILKFCLVGWGLPAVLVVALAAADRNSYGLQEYGKGGAGGGASEFCWLLSPLLFYTTCVGFFCLVFLLNVAMFVVVMLQICGRNGKRSNRTLREEVLRNLRSVVSLTFLLGMTWGFALFAWGPVSVAFIYLFCIFNSLQGLFIFVFHCALKENVQKQWRRYLCCGRFRLSDHSDWSKTATNNTKKVSSDKSLSSSSLGSSATHWTSKAKATLNPFSKRHSSSGEDKSHAKKGISFSSSSSTSTPITSELQPGSAPSSSPSSSSSSSSSSILPVSQMFDKVRDYCSTRTDNFYKNILMSDSLAHSTKF